MTKQFNFQSSRIQDLSDSIMGSVDLSAISGSHAPETTTSPQAVDIDKTAMPPITATPRKSTKGVVIEIPRETYDILSRLKDMSGLTIKQLCLTAVKALADCNKDKVM